MRTSVRIDREPTKTLQGTNASSITGMILHSKRNENSQRTLSRLMIHHAEAAFKHIAVATASTPLHMVPSYITGTLFPYRHGRRRPPADIPTVDPKTASLHHLLTGNLHWQHRLMLLIRHPLPNTVTPIPHLNCMLMHTLMCHKSRRSIPSLNADPSRFQCFREKANLNEGARTLARWR